MNRIGSEKVGRGGPAWRDRPWAVASLMALAVLGGCAGEPKGESASGSVTWQGRPLDQGDIMFTPATGDGLPVGTVIQAGHYELPNPPGIAAGEYKVRIQSRGQRTTGADGTPDFGIANPAAAEQIPRQFNDETTLKAQVTAGGANTFDFDLNGTRKKESAKVASRPR